MIEKNNIHNILSFTGVDLDEAKVSAHSYTIIGEYVCFDTINEIKEYVKIYSPKQSIEEIYTNDEHVNLVYVELLTQLKHTLNNAHGENLTLRQWELIIGPWLKLWLDSLSVRWHILKDAIDKGFDELRVLNIDNKNIILPVPDSRDDFSRLVNQSSLWNQYIFSYMLINYYKKHDGLLKKVDRISKVKNIDAKNNNIRVLLNNGIKLMLELVSNAIPGSKKIIINSPYLGLYILLRLSFILKKFPVFYFVKKYNKCANNFQEKKDRINFTKSSINTQFAQLAIKLLPQQVPRCYLEQWSCLNEHMSKLKLPKFAEIIYTGSGVPSDEYFRLYIARQVANGTKYVITQHGGVYGVMLVQPKAEFYEHRVADLWLSWGWSSEKYSNVVSGVNVKNCNTETVKPLKNGKLLVVLPVIRFSPTTE